MAEKQIVKVKYYSETTGELSGREYTYYSEDALKVGDIVTVPVRDTTGKAQVSAIDVLEPEIAAFKDKVKMIPAGSVVSGDSLRQPSPLKDVPTIATGGTNAPTEIPTTALVKVNPEVDIQVLLFLAESNKLRDYAEARVITTAEDLKPATDDLSIIAKLKKAMEEKRKEYVKPLQDHVKAVNDTFKKMMEPIEIADQVTRGKILAFQFKQKLIREEQEKINALRVEAAKKEMELKGELTESVNLVEVIPEVAKRTTSDLGSATMKDNWTFQVIDFALLPDEYKMPDAVKIGKVVRAGLHTIPGVKIENKPIIAVNTR